jgi:hypothetical protein
MSKQSKNPPDGPPGEMRYHFVKSPAFRAIHVDGAIGAPTPQGILHVSFYNERTPIPQELVHPLEKVAEGKYKVGPPIAEKTITRDGTLRELEFSAYMSLDTARSVHEWLGKMIKEMEGAGL